MTNEELVQRLDAQTTKLAKIQTEVQALKDAINNSGNVPPEVQEALTRLENAVQATDDLNEDAPPPAEEQ